MLWPPFPGVQISAPSRSGCCSRRNFVPFSSLEIESLPLTLYLATPYCPCLCAVPSFPFLSVFFFSFPSFLFFFLFYFFFFYATLFLFSPFFSRGRNRVRAKTESAEKAFDYCRQAVGHMQRIICDEEPDESGFHRVPFDAGSGYTEVEVLDLFPALLGAPVITFEMILEHLEAEVLVFERFLLEQRQILEKNAEENSVPNEEDSAGQQDLGRKQSSAGCAVS